MRRFIRIWLLAAAVALVVACPAFNTVQAGEAQSVLAKYAVLHQGKSMQVCGVVSGVFHASMQAGAPTYINLDQPYPHDSFFMIVWQRDQEKFPEGYFDALAGKAVAVTGPIGRAEKSGKGFVTVTDPAQITVIETVISAEEAKRHIGRYVQLQAFLADVKERPDQSGMPTYLNFGQLFPDHQLLGIIWGPNRGGFEELELLKGKVVLVRGIVEEGPDGRPFVQLADVSQLGVLKANAAEGSVQ